MPQIEPHPNSWQYPLINYPVGHASFYSKNGEGELKDCENPKGGLMSENFSLWLKSP